MVFGNTERFHDALARTQWDEDAALLQIFQPQDAATTLRNLPFEQQQSLFRRIPLDRAATLLPRLPYYDQYVLLHSRTRDDMRLLVGKIDPDGRMPFFDEFPEAFTVLSRFLPPPGNTRSQLLSHTCGSPCSSL
jgi:Mg/Co/Ni transporter MgtE